MTQDSTKVRVAVTGAVSLGDGTAVAPTDASTALGTGFTDLGLIGDGGITESRGRTTNNIKAWQNGATVRTVVTDGTLTYKFIMLETKKETVETYYGSTVTQTITDGSIVVVPTNTGGRKKFVLDVIDGAELIRAWIPSGEVTEVGDRVYANGEPIGYECTVTCYPDASIPDDNGQPGCAKVWATALKS